LRRIGTILIPAALVAAALAPATSSAQTSDVTITGNTPGWLSAAKDLGPTDPSASVGLTVWLRLQNENQLTSAVAAVNTKGNPNYHKFLTPGQVNQTYEPTNGTVNGVTNWLQAKGFTIADTASNNTYIDVTGTVAQAEQAFNVSIHSFSYGGQTFFSNTTDPRVDNSNGVNGQIAAVDGLDNSNGYGPTSVARPSDNGSSGPASFPVTCGSPTDSLTIPLDHNKTTTIKGLLPCGYGAKQIESAYGVDQLCSYTTSSVSGTCGQGQTIVITDAYGSSTLQQDVNAYDAANGLPALTVGQNLTVVNEPGITANKPANRHWGDPHAWQAEVTLDVENAHAMAPGANIVLIAAPNNGAPLDEALNWAVIHHYGNIVSSSWGLPEIFLTPAHLNRTERILQTGALEGIGFNFSTGDDGDTTLVDGVKAAGYPSSSPNVTAVGGTSLFLTSTGQYVAESGWGTHIIKQYSCLNKTTAADGTNTCTSYAPTDPSVGDLGFQFGAGGGPSQFFAAPSWQQAAGVSSSVRQTPDVSMLADPETGSNIYITDLQIGATSPIVEQYGGTSLATPLFSAMMALVDQTRAALGKSPAGQTAPALYTSGVLGTSALHDVNGVPSFAQNGLHYRGTSSGSIFDVTFNQDTSLTTSAGWDNVTGVGSPNGQSFITAMANQ
jgi:subtilase family serine protease